MIRHTGGKPTQNIRDSDSHVPNAGAATPLAWFNCDNLMVVHSPDFNMKRVRGVANTVRNDD